MIEFGKTLRIARETKGFTASQIADKTHMLVQVVEGLENEDFSRIVAPIYGRGFVKLYCEAVGLEPKPLVDEFMEIYSGNRAATIRERPVPEAPAPAAPEIPVPTAPPPTEFDFAGIRAHAESTATAEATVSEPSPTHTPSRYAAPMPIDDRPSFGLPSFNWRMLVLAAATIAVLVLLGFGIRALYHATMDVPAEPGVAAAAGTEEASARDAQPAAGATVEPESSRPKPAERKPLPAQPFYID